MRCKLVEANCRKGGRRSDRRDSVNTMLISMISTIIFKTDPVMIGGALPMGGAWRATESIVRPWAAGCLCVSRSSVAAFSACACTVCADVSSAVDTVFVVAVLG